MKAVFGFSADPPQNGHLDSLYIMCKSNLFDEVLVIPCGRRSDKQKISCGHLRLELTKRMLLELPDVYKKMVILDEREVHGEAILSSLLLRKLRFEQPDVKFYFFVGADLVEPKAEWGGGCQITQYWAHGKPFFEENYFVVAPRVRYRDPHEFGLNPEKFIILDETPRGAASSDIRSLKSEGKPWEHLVPAAVAQCIKENNLYMNTKE